MWDFLFKRFHMYVYYGVFAKRLPYFMFYFGGFVVRFHQRHAAIHSHMHANNMIGAYLSRSQMVHLADTFA